MKKILVTGGAGFIGSNYILKTLKENREIFLVNLDSLTYAGNLENLKELTDTNRYNFVKGSINDYQLVNRLFADFHFDVVINFAAESHVDRSIKNPSQFLETNIMGTQILLEVAKKYWKVEKDNKYSRLFLANKRFIQVSTDEVYGTLDDIGFFTEETSVKPNSPYSASKASADLICRSYYETYGFPILISRCSNNYGPYQFPEKLIPLVINNSINNHKIPVYGKGQQIRDWLYVEDHVDALNAILKNGIIGEVYNIGGNNELKNLDLVSQILETMSVDESLIEFVNDRPGHDYRYAIDNTKISKELSWKPKYAFKDGLEKTIKWYKENQQWIKKVLNQDYMKYYEKMYGFNKKNSK